MNFASRVLASAEIEALTYEQFRKWNYDKQVDYLNRHPESDFRLPEDEEKRKGDDEGTPSEDDANQGQGDGAAAPEGEGEQAPEPGPAPEEKPAAPVAPSSQGPGSVGTPRAGDADSAPAPASDEVPDPTPDLVERGTQVTNRKTGETAVRMDYEQSRDLIEDYLNRGWALKYDLASGSELQKGDQLVTLTTEPSGKSLVRVSKDTGEE